MHGNARAFTNCRVRPIGADQKWLSTTGFLDKVDSGLKAAMKM